MNVNFIVRFGSNTTVFHLHIVTNAGSGYTPSNSTYIVVMGGAEINRSIFRTEHYRFYQVQHYPFRANWVFVRKAKTIGSLYCLALLILTESSKSKNQVVHEQKFKDPLSSTCQIIPECWTWNQRLFRGPGSIPTRGNIFF